MSDLREIGARAWHEDEDHVWENAHPLFRESVMEAMDKAIIAIEPHLRRKHRQELYRELYDEGYVDDRNWMSDRAEKEGLTLE